MAGSGDVTRRACVAGEGTWRRMSPCRFESRHLARMRAFAQTRQLASLDNMHDSTQVELALRNSSVATARPFAGLDIIALF